MKLNEMKEHIGKKVFVKYKGYNSLDGEYILTGIMQRCEIENKKMESGIFIKVSELPPQRASYWIDINNTKLMFLQNAETEKEKESIPSNNISEQQRIEDIQKNTLQRLKAMQGGDVK